MRKLFSIILFTVFAILGFSQSVEKRGIRIINENSAKTYIEFLSNDLLEGREAGTRGGKIASLYIASVLKAMRIEPLSDSYFWNFQVYRENSKSRYQLNNSSLEEKSGGERLDLRNVLGKIEGKNPNEYVVIGAHYDHLGIDKSLADDQIYNGADDNASGVSAVLQITKACLETGVKPERTIIFAFWDGEEKGLLGSKYFTEYFSQIENVKVYLNFDMIGRNSDETKPMDVAYFYSEDYPKFKTWSENDIVDHNLKITPNYHPSPYAMGGSDNASFTKKGIPIIWYHTGGHLDYHKTTDHVDKINWGKVVEITKSAFLNIWKLANEKEYK